MIPNGQEIIIDGHKVVFESTTYQCRGCFFENRDSCPDCDEGIWVEDNPSPWHTGTPTEEGCFYALQCKGHIHPEPYFGVVVNGKFSAISWDGDLMPLPPDLIAWQKVEPYKDIKTLPQEVWNYKHINLPNEHGRIVDLDKVLDWLINDKRVFSMVMSAKIDNALKDAPVILEATV